MPGKIGTRQTYATSVSKSKVCVISAVCISKPKWVSAGHILQRSRRETFGGNEPSHGPTPNPDTRAYPKLKDLSSPAQTTLAVSFLIGNPWVVYVHRLSAHLLFTTNMVQPRKLKVWCPGANSKATAILGSPSTKGTPELGGTSGVHRKLRCSDYSSLVTF